MVVRAEVAQSVEQRTENPCVRSSILRLGTTWLRRGAVLPVLFWILPGVPG